MKTTPPSAPTIQPAIIADRLKKARKDLGLSQVDLAKSAGISRSAIVRYEKGEVVPGGLKLGKLARALGMSPNELLSGADAYFPSRRREHALVRQEDIQATSMRVTLCLMALDRKIREQVSALLMAMVEERKTKAEFNEFLQAIDAVHKALARVEPQIEQVVDDAVSTSRRKKR